MTQVVLQEQGAAWRLGSPVILYMIYDKLKAKGYLKPNKDVTLVAYSLDHMECHMQNVILIIYAGKRNSIMYLDFFPFSLNSLLERMKFWVYIVHFALGIQSALKTLL